MFTAQITSMLLPIMKTSMLIYIINKNHTINNLILLEFIAMAMLASLMVILNNLNKELFFTLFLMIILIMESILGLSILILMIRTHGNDYLKSMSMMNL